MAKKTLEPSNGIEFNGVVLDSSGADFNSQRLKNASYPGARIDGEDRASDVANRKYVDRVYQGMFTPVNVALILNGSNINLSSDIYAGVVIEDITLNLNDVVCLTSQTDLTENGLYVVGNFGDPLVRYTDKTLYPGTTIRSKNNIYYYVSLIDSYAEDIILDTTEITFNNMNDPIFRYVGGDAYIKMEGQYLRLNQLDENIIKSSSFSTGITGGGGEKIKLNYIDKVEHSSATSGSPLNLGYVDSGTTVTNIFSSEKVYVNLPPASSGTGMNFTFHAYSSNGINIQADTNDFIRIDSMVSTEGGYADTVVAGSVVKIMNISDYQWVAVSLIGTWTVSV